MVSPDDRRAVLGGASDDFNGVVSILDLERGTVSRLSEPSEDVGSPVWSPDGQRVAYLDHSIGLTVRSLADGTTRQLLASDPSYKRLDEWSRDGRYLVVERLNATTKWDAWLVPVDGDSTPQVAVRSAANDEAPRLSPDGRWVAYTSDETGTLEIYVSAVGSAGLKYQVTNGGGGPWYWARDGKSLVFVKSDQPVDLLRAVVQPTPEFSLAPASMFLRLPEDISYSYPDSAEKRFLTLLPVEKPERQTITLIQNWPAALREP